MGSLKTWKCEVLQFNWFTSLANQVTITKVLIALFENILKKALAEVSQTWYARQLHAKSGWRSTKIPRHDHNASTTVEQSVQPLLKWYHIRQNLCTDHQSSFLYIRITTVSNDSSYAVFRVLLNILQTFQLWSGTETLLNSSFSQAMFSQFEWSVLRQKRWLTCLQVLVDISHILSGQPATDKQDRGD